MNHRDNTERKLPDCPNCGHDLNEPINDIWKDPNVQAALKEGRPVEDIAVLRCPKCSRWNYYNQGSSYWCRFCQDDWVCLSEGESHHGRKNFIRLDEEGFTSLADTITEVTEGYDNRTP